MGKSDMAKPEQLAFDLPHRAALGAEDLIVSASNRAAVDMVDSWPNWSNHAVLISGPTGCGKTHLVNVWRIRSEARVVDAAAVDDGAIAELTERGVLAVENLQVGGCDERLLFHLLNTAREHQGSVLITARQAAGEMNSALPDLRSRVRALPHVAVLPPDEALLRALLVKLFADRQLSVEPPIVGALTLHMERSAEVAAAVVAEIDRRQLASQRKVTRALALDALAAVTALRQTHDTLSDAPGGAS